MYAKEASRATQDVDDARKQVHEANMKFFRSGLKADQNRLASLSSASALVKSAEHRHICNWQRAEEQKACNAVKQQMLDTLQVWVLDKFEHYGTYLNTFLAKTAERNDISANQVLMMMLIDLNTPGTRTNTAQKQLLTAAARENDLNADFRIASITLPDFAKQSSPMGLIDEIRSIEDRSKDLKQSIDLRYVLQYHRESQGFGRTWSECRLMTSTANQPFLATTDGSKENVAMNPGHPANHILYVTVIVLPKTIKHEQRR